ncbi:MAG: hypothetical protein FWB74_06835 [Defluviitaleaceae bacterium]|nr:hypothetical protein [Defluviitaleaceae bacterium]
MNTFKKGITALSLTGVMAFAGIGGVTAFAHDSTQLEEVRAVYATHDEGADRLLRAENMLGRFSELLGSMSARFDERRAAIEAFDIETFDVEAFKNNADRPEHQRMGRLRGFNIDRVEGRISALPEGVEIKRQTFDADSLREMFEGIERPDRPENTRNFEGREGMSEALSQRLQQFRQANE